MESRGGCGKWDFPSPLQCMQDRQEAPMSPGTFGF